MRRLPADFRPMTPSRRLVVRSADGTRLAVEIHGETDATAHRPTVVLVHGWTCSASFWVRVVNRLRGQARVVVYDQRGHGRSQPVCEGGFTPSTLADDLAAVLEATVPEGERAVVAGHSMGAMSLVAMAGRHPDVLHARVGAALLASTGIAELTGRLAVLPARTPWAQAQLTRLVVERPADARQLRRLPLPLVRAVISRVTLSRTAARVERAYTTDIVLACPPATYTGFAAMLTTLDLRAELAMLDLPALVLVGSADRLTPPWHAHQMATSLPRPLGLVEIPKTGHMTPLTAPDAVTEAIHCLLPPAEPDTLRTAPRRARAVERGHHAGAGPEGGLRRTVGVGVRRGHG